MDVTSLYYFTELAKDLNMSRTADRIFVSQQTISNHIQRLEEYYGTKLFYRKPTLSLTAAGEYVLKFANQFQMDHTNLRDLLNDIEFRSVGTLRIGGSAMRVSTFLPIILPEFSARYPNVDFAVTNRNSNELEPLVLAGELDFAVALEGEVDPAIEARFLMQDQIYLCAADSLLRKHVPDLPAFKKRALSGLDIRTYTGLPLCFQPNRMSERILTGFRNEKIKPQIFLTSDDVQVAYSVCCGGLAACFAPKTRLIGPLTTIPEDMNVFPLYMDGKPFIQNLYLLRRHDRYLTAYAEDFIELLCDCLAEVEERHIERAV